VKHLKYAIILSLIATSSYADSLNFTMPNPSTNYQSDKFRAGDLDCSNAIGSATNLEFGVTGIINQNEENGILNDSGIGDTNVGVFARIVIPLGKRAKSRIDCNKLYELELRKKQLEVMKLEQELKRLRELQFAN
jgi:hypothetical protein